MECLEKKYGIKSRENHKPLVFQDSTDVELDAFSILLQLHLKKLPDVERLEAQQNILKVLSDAIKKLN